MAYAEAAVGRVRTALIRRKGVSEKIMFGGVTFLVRGHMCCGVTKEDELMVRVGEARAEKLARRRHTRFCDITEPPMKSMLLVSPPGYRRKADLRNWLDEAVRFVRSLPPKERDLSVGRP